MITRIAALAAVLVLSACAGSDTAVQKQNAAVEPAAPSRETFAIGSSLTHEGAVTASSANDSFRRGPELYLSIDVNSASTDQVIAVQWQDARERVIREDRRNVPQNGRYATFSTGPTQAWRPGRHRAVIVIDGRRVSEKHFDLM